ncbi:tetratricopeptide repeat protein, partial [Patescibacteria group bacterium]
YESAMPILENSVILKPDYSNAKYYLGLCYYNLGRTNDAVLQFKDLVILNPESAEVKVILENLEEGYSPFYGMKGVQPSSQSSDDSGVIEE